MTCLLPSAPTALQEMLLIDCPGWATNLLIHEHDTMRREADRCHRQFQAHIILVASETGLESFLTTASRGVATSTGCRTSCRRDADEVFFMAAGLA